MDLKCKKESEQVALQTMKDRCSALQAMVDKMELEIRALSRQKADASQGDDQLATLRGNLAQVSAEKSQLLQHVANLSEENRKLWAHLARDAENLAYSPPNLVRSHTFTVNRSLERASFHLISSLLLEQNELVHQMEALKDEPDSFSDQCDRRPLAQIKKQTDNFSQLRLLAAQQQTLLQKYKSHLDAQPDKRLCPSCTAKPKSATDVQQSTIFNKEASPWQKRDSQKSRVCPMCGVRFEYLPFDDFELHVESHFMTKDDSDSPQDNLDSIHNNFN